MENKRQKGLPTYPGYKKTYSVFTLLITMETMTIIAQSYFLARAITYLFQRTPIEDVLFYIGFFFTAFIFRYIIGQLQMLIAEKYSLHVSTYLREKLLYEYFHKPSHYVQQVGTGHLVQLLMEGIDDVKKYVEIIGVRTIKTIIGPLFIVAYIFFHNKLSAIILIVTVPIVIIFMILLGMAAEKMADSQYALYTRLANHFTDSLKGLETLAYLGKSKEHGKRIEKVSEDYRQSTMKTLRIAFLSSFALDFFTSLSIAFVAVNLGYGLINGDVALLPALTILLLAPEYFSPIKQVGKDYHATLDGQLAMDEINEWIKAGEAAHDTKQSNTMIIATPIKTIALENIVFTLGSQPILQPITVTAKRGLIGIIGASGAGKSTLIQLLAGRITPTSGTFMINGSIYHHIHHEAWLQHIAYIPQHPYIFPISLADNIRFYEPNVTDEKVEEIIEKIGLKHVVASFPNGIHEQIGEGGQTLSGGQEQRIAIARALLSDQEIILLDEPTAHLDIETEYEIKQLILNMMSDKFVFIATHRLHWLENTSAVWMMQHGQLIAAGKHETLKQTNETYSAFYHAQRGGQTSE